VSSLKSFKKRIDLPLDKSNDLPKNSQEFFGVVNHFGKKEKRLSIILLLTLLISLFVFLIQFNNNILVPSPVPGGQLTEGVVGVPRFINPILAISDSDKDLTNLVFSGLLRVTPEGNYEPYLAENYGVSEDGLEYFLQLKENALWHDGEPIDADDVLFTINLIRDNRVKSPLEANWNGIEVIKTSEKNLKFVLPQPYAPFLENLTLAPIPEHIWKDVEPEQIIFSTNNIDAVGSGPYKISNVPKDGDGIPKSVSLKAWDKHAAKSPYIEKIKVMFFADEESLVKAYESRDIDNAGRISPISAVSILQNGGHIQTQSLPRAFAVFFNQGRAGIFTKSEIREALNTAIDKEKFINNSLLGFADPLNGPIPQVGLSIKTVDDSELTATKKAREILSEAGWEDSEGVMTKETEDGNLSLSFSIATANTPELKKIAEEVKRVWSQVGANIELKFFEVADLNQNIIRPREYDALLFGQISGRYPDPFVFWHSSQTLDPGLNVASYTSSDANEVVEKIRETNDIKERNDLYRSLTETINEDLPATFLYSPKFIYATNESIGGMDLGSIADPSDRFLNVDSWYLHEDKTWKLFTK